MTTTAVDWLAEVSRMVLAAGDQLVAVGLSGTLMLTASLDRPRGYAWLGGVGASPAVEVLAITPETHERGRREWPEYSHMLLPVGAHVFAVIPEPWLRDRHLVSSGTRSVPGWSPGARGGYYRARVETIEEAVSVLSREARRPPGEVRG